MDIGYSKKNNLHVVLQRSYVNKLRGENDRDISYAWVGRMRKHFTASIFETVCIESDRYG